MYERTVRGRETRAQPSEFIGLENWKQTGWQLEIEKHGKRSFRMSAEWKQIYKLFGDLWLGR